MMLMSQAASAIRGELIGSDTLFSAVSKDTRDITEGDLYIAIKGERFDGHSFIEQAGQAGAAGALVSEQQSFDLPQIRVDDTRIALGELAAYWRNQFNGKVIGITGSNGKTSVKEMTRSICEQAAGAEHVVSTIGNLNNDIGMPMTMLRLRRQHLYAVIEMGANHPKEIEYLTNIARPHVAVINNAGPAHLEGFGSIEGVARSKAEIYGGLVDEGVAVVNADDDYAGYWKDLCSHLGGRQQILTFSMEDDRADIYAQVLGRNGNTEFELRTPAGTGRVQLDVPGDHNVMNALAAAALTTALDIKLEYIIAGLNAFSGVGGRLASVRSRQGATIINDTYNANPRSLNAAMRVLAGTGKDSWLVLGDMAELGEETEAMHRQAGEQARELGIRHLLATGNASRHAVDAFGEGGEFLESKEQLVKVLEQSIDGNSVVLVKGSRSMAMETVVEGLTKDKQEVH